MLIYFTSKRALATAPVAAFGILPPCAGWVPVTELPLSFGLWLYLTLWFPWIKLHHCPLPQGSLLSALTPGAAWLTLCAILCSPASDTQLFCSLWPPWRSLALQSQGSFRLFRAACWRYLRWECHSAIGKVEKRSRIEVNQGYIKTLQWETWCITMLLKSTLGTVTKLHKDHYTIFFCPFLSGESQTKTQLSNISLPASRWFL